MTATPNVGPNGNYPCPMCMGKTKVIDSRPSHDVVRRRRKCLACQYRFTTFEITAEAGGQTGASVYLPDALESLSRAMRNISEAQETMAAVKTLQEKMEKHKGSEA